MDWKCGRPCSSSGPPYWRRESVGWRTGFECSGRRSLKKWAKRALGDGFKKWNGSAKVSCFRMGVGCWTIGDYALLRGKQEQGRIQVPDYSWEVNPSSLISARRSRKAPALIQASPSRQFSPTLDGRYVGTRRNQISDSPVIGLAENKV